MPKVTPSSTRRLGEDEADARRRLLAAAERCVAKYGIRKTTMDDIAREAGISRPSVYRYFSDREDLLVNVVAEHSRALADRFHHFIEIQSTFADAICEGMLYLAHHAQRDDFFRDLLDANDNAISSRLGQAQSQASMAADFWRDYLTAAQARGDMKPELDLDRVHEWLADLGLLLTLQIGRAPEDDMRRREMIRSFVLPALVANASNGTGTAKPVRRERRQR